jgi:hypothetical protein
LDPSPCAPTIVQTLIIVIPLFHNPDSHGQRIPVESTKIEETKDEIRKRFNGYSMSVIVGWYRGDMHKYGYSDRNLRFEIDGTPDEFDWAYLQTWKKSLEVRFDQRSIYMRLSKSAWLI